MNTHTHTTLTRFFPLKYCNLMNVQQDHPRNPALFQAKARRWHQAKPEWQQQFL